MRVGITGSWLDWLFLLLCFLFLPLLGILAALYFAVWSLLLLLCLGLDLLAKPGSKKLAAALSK